MAAPLVANTLPLNNLRFKHKALGATKESQRLAVNEFAEDRSRRDGGYFLWGKGYDVVKELKHAFRFGIGR